MAIKFTAKDQPKTAPAATEVKAGKPAPAAAKDAAPEGTDLFNPDAKATGKRKPK
jgi:hypothetical protein